MAFYPALEFMKWYVFRHIAFSDANKTLQVIDSHLCTSLIFKELRKIYPEESLATISVAASALLGLKYMSGPLVGTLIEQFGCKPLMVFGCVLSAISQQYIIGYNWNRNKLHILASIDIPWIFFQEKVVFS